MKKENKNLTYIESIMKNGVVT